MRNLSDTVGRAYLPGGRIPNSGKAMVGEATAFGLPPLLGAAAIVTAAAAISV